MVAFSLGLATVLVAVAGVAAAPAAVNVPTVPLCHNDGACYNMPVVGSGSCCGSYNITTWLELGGTHIGEGVLFSPEKKPNTPPPHTHHTHTRRAIFFPGPATGSASPFPHCLCSYLPMCVGQGLGEGCLW